MSKLSDLIKKYKKPDDESKNHKDKDDKVDYNKKNSDEIVRMDFSKNIDFDADPEDVKKQFNSIVQSAVLYATNLTRQESKQELERLSKNIHDEYKSDLAKMNDNLKAKSISPYELVPALKEIAKEKRESLRRNHPQATTEEIDEVVKEQMDQLQADSLSYAGAEIVTKDKETETSNFSWDEDMSDFAKEYSDKFDEQENKENKDKENKDKD